MDIIQEQPNSVNEISQSEKTTYFMNEYIFSILPCYIFIVTSIVRAIRIRNKKIKVLLYSYDDTSKSFRIKARISQFQAFSYLVSIILSFVCPSRFYWGANFAWSNAFYLFGIAAWIDSYYLLKYEYIREQKQSLYAHRGFWIFSFCFSMMRLFQEQMALVNIIMNVTRSIPNLILLMYAMYKPFDKDKTFQEYENIPSFARIFFEKLENNSIVAKLLGYTIDSKNLSLKSPLIKDIELQENIHGFIEPTYMDELEFQQLTQNSFDLEKQLYNNLPRRIAIVNQRAENKIEEGVKRVYYTVITTIGDNIYRVSKKYIEFEEIYNQLTQIYSHENYTHLEKEFPQFDIVQHFEQDIEKKRIFSIQDWLNKIFQFPLFMHKLLLDFLNVEEEQQAPFIVYYQHVSVMKGYKNPTLEKAKKSKDSANNHQEFYANIENHIQNRPRQSTTRLRKSTTAQLLIDIEQIIQARKEQFNFQVHCINAEKSSLGNQQQYVFDVVFIAEEAKNKKQTYKWAVSKTMTEMKQLNQQLEEYLQFNISSFQIIQSVWNIKDQNDKQSVKKKVEALDSYIQAIFKQKAYYCKILFDFIEFDPEREIHHNSNMVTPRQTILNHLEDRTRPSTQNSLTQYLGNDQKKENHILTANKRQNKSLILNNKINNKILFYLKLQDENFIRKFSFINDINENDFFQKNQQVLLKRYNYTQRYIHGLNLNRAIIIRPKQFRNEKKEVTEYLIHLEEFDTFGHVSKQIRLLKDYDQIKQLNDVLKRVYNDANMEFPSLPFNRQPINQFIADEMKKEFDKYFEKLLELTDVEQSRDFENFFHLRDLKYHQQYYERDMMIYDFVKVDEQLQNHFV